MKSTKNQKSLVRNEQSIPPIVGNKNYQSNSYTRIYTSGKKEGKKEMLGAI